MKKIKIGQFYQSYGQLGRGLFYETRCITCFVVSLSVLPGLEFDDFDTTSRICSRVYFSTDDALLVINIHREVFWTVI